MKIGNVGIGNIFTLATLNKCFAFTDLNASAIPELNARV